MAAVLALSSNDFQCMVTISACQEKQVARQLASHFIIQSPASVAHSRHMNGTISAKVAVLVLTNWPTILNYF